VQIFGLHGDVLGVALVVVAAIAAWLLLPSPAGAQRAPDSSIQD